MHYGIPPNLTQKNVAQVGEANYWSTYRFAAGTQMEHADYLLFAVPQGLCGQGFEWALSLIDTNVKQPGIQSFSALIIHEVDWLIFGGTSKCREALHVGSAWQWDFVQTLLPGGASTNFDFSPDPQVDMKEWIMLQTSTNKIRGRKVYSKVPVHLPANAHTRIRLSTKESDHVFRKHTFIRFNLKCQYQTVIEIG